MAEQRHQVHLLSPYIEGELSPHERKLVKSHLDTCTSCRHELSLLRQTVDALEELPLEKTSVDFLEKFHRRVERDAQLHRLEEQRTLNQRLDAHNTSPCKVQSVAALSSAWLGSLLPQVVNLRRFLPFPSPIKISIYATAAGLAFAVFLLSPPQERVPPGREKVTRESVTPPAAPLSQKVSDVVAESVHPVGDSLPVAEQPPVSSPPLASREAGFSMVKPVLWRLAGSQPEVLREQVEVLANQMADAVIVQAGEEILVIALPTQKLAMFRQGVSKLGQLHAPYEEAESSEQTIVLHVTFAYALIPFPPP